MITSEYIDSKMNTIIHADCLEVMRKIPDNYFGLILTDPPYGIGASRFLNRKNYSADGDEYKRGNSLASKKKYDIKEWDNQIPSREVFNEMKRISQHQIIFGGNYFVDMLDNSQCWIVWDKVNGTNDFADCELAWTTFKSSVRKYTFAWNGFIQQDMSNKEERHHPTQKPIELFKMILRDYAIKLDKKTVFDPFGGSCTTAIASKSLGLDWCVCELEEDYCKIGEERLRKVQLSLF